MSEEWSRWYEHDGGLCPCKNQYVQAARLGMDVWEGLAASKNGPISLSAWRWALPGGVGSMREGIILRYRIRQFKAMKDLKRLVEEPEKAPA